MPDEYVWVVIAAYNEARVIERVIADVRHCGFTAVLVDDGSSDATAEVAERVGAVVVRQPVNLGRGAALQTGIEFALRKGADVIVTFDADGQHRATDIAGLVDALARHSVDYALGSRFLGGGPDLPAVRRRPLQAAAGVSRLTRGLSLADTPHGVRGQTRP